MNENKMNLPETQLQSWQPRPPSARLRQRIFFAGHSRSATAWFMGSLAPVAACALLSLVILNSENGFPAGSGNHGTLVATILSNQNYAASVLDGSQNEQNRLPAIIFDSTNGGVNASSIRFSPFTKPN